VYHWGESDAKVRPFAVAGLGATLNNPRDTLHPGGPNGNFDSNTQFSTTWGAGVKLYPSPHIGVRVTGQWTPTYIKSTSAGYWCDPFYGCWVVGDPDYSHQFDLSGAIVIRF